MWLNWQFISAVLKVIFRHPVFGVSLVPILPDGRIALVCRRDCKKWSLPGGMVDWGENISHTLKRELKEETGLDFLRIKRLVGVYSSPYRDPRLHSICVLIAIEVEGEMKVEDNREITDVKAFTTEYLKTIDDLAHDHNQQLKDYLDGRTTID